MAVGDVVVFNQFLQDVGRATHNLETDTIRFALITNAVTPAATTADPRWGAGGGTNFDTNEVTAGGNYVAEGGDIAATYSQAAGTATFDGTDISIAQNASNPTNARWGIIYNDTAAGNQCIAFLDLGSVIDLSTGSFTVTWNASGIFTMA
jgi:hypothetical protein